MSKASELRKFTQVVVEARTPSSMYYTDLVGKLCDIIAIKPSSVVVDYNGDRYEVSIDDVAPYVPSEQMTESERKQAEVMAEARFGLMADEVIRASLIQLTLDQKDEARFNQLTSPAWRQSILSKKKEEAI